MAFRMESATKAKTPRYSAEQWEAQKINVERLYISEDRTLKEVIQILDHEFGFVASEKQLKSRLPRWGFDTKNMKRETMLALARAKAKRKLDDKESSFRVHKKPIDDHNIERFLTRYDISEEDLLEMASPINAPSPAFSVFTPRSVRSPTPGPDFQALSLGNSPRRSHNEVLDVGLVKKNPNKSSSTETEPIGDGFSIASIKDKLHIHLPTTLLSIAEELSASAIEPKDEFYSMVDAAAMGVEDQHRLSSAIAVNNAEAVKQPTTSSPATPPNMKGEIEERRMPERFREEWVMELPYRAYFGQDLSSSESQPSSRTLHRPLTPDLDVWHCVSVYVAAKEA
ncbi:hypothetical protein EG329_001380 [Mollisiaceae sp. DMI_Dod_QoI]|nr:hypothetical protein EG329_001380 [Helotiales sp. DMI_Dod_QoI]